jgi:hypothetical protein
VNVRGGIRGCKKRHCECKKGYCACRGFTMVQFGNFQIAGKEVRLRHCGKHRRGCHKMCRG